MNRHRASTAVGILVLLAFSHDANAVTISIGSQNTTTIPTTNFITAPDSTTGIFNLSQSGTHLPNERSPYEGTGIENTPYSVLSAGGVGAGTATYNCSDCTTFSLLWGSPDSYNFLDFYTGLNGTGTLIRTVIGTDLVPPASQGLGFDEVSFSTSGTGSFDSVVLRNSGQAAFEYSNVSFPGVDTRSVPGPVVGAGLPGLLAACGGLLALARRRRKAALA
jgi:hypothetical protein